MIKKAFLFSGQGAQCAGMALPILERFPRAAAYFSSSSLFLHKSPDILTAKLRSSSLPLAEEELKKQAARPSESRYSAQRS